jgi:excisionase family DNA binding protein
MEMTTQEAARLLGVRPNRVRALIASGMLDARHVGNIWLIKAESVEHQRNLTTERSHGRPMASRSAWSLAALLDGRYLPGMKKSEENRLLRLVDTNDDVDAFRRRLLRRCDGHGTYLAAEADAEALLREPDVVRTGVSASEALGVGLSSGSSADLYVSGQQLPGLIDRYYLVRSGKGNVTLRVAPDGLHIRSAEQTPHGLVAPRAIVGADLADSTDTRTRSAGRRLLAQTLAVREDPA